MKKYEGLFIVRPDLTEEETGKVSASISEVITKNGAEIEHKEDMGLRTLSYTIKKQKKGRYFLIYFSAEPKVIAPMERSYKLNESILRAFVFDRQGEIKPQEMAVLPAEDEKAKEI